MLVHDLGDYTIRADGNAVWINSKTECVARLQKSGACVLGKRCGKTWGAFCNAVRKRLNVPFVFQQYRPTWTLWLDMDILKAERHWQTVRQRFES